MNTLTLILASVLTTCVAQVLYALITLKNGWYSTPVRWVVAVLFLASSGGALWFVLANLMGGESLLPALMFVVCQALAVTLVVGSGLRGIVHSGNLAEERAKRLQETANEANKRLKDMQELATEVRERLEEETTAIRERLEEQATRTQGERDQVKHDLGAEQAKVRDALSEKQSTVGQDTNTRIREMQERGQSDQPEERTDRAEGHKHRSDIDAKLLADTETRSQERQDDREERAEERRDEREERAEERRDTDTEDGG